MGTTRDFDPDLAGSSGWRGLLISIDVHLHASTCGTPEKHPIAGNHCSFIDVGDEFL